MTTKALPLIPLSFVIFGILAKCYDPEINKDHELFKVSRDTIQVTIEGRLSRCLLIHDKYYALYEVRDPVSTGFIKKFYIIRKNGEIEKEVKVPEGVNDDTYPKVYHWYGRIVINTEFYKNTYYLDEGRGKFVKASEGLKIPLYEDENYRVTSECRGEFGSTTYFTNKSTGRTYSTTSGCPLVVNKLDDKYFVSAFDFPGSDIMEIEDPAKTDMETKHSSAKTAHKLSTQYIFKNDDFVPSFSFPTSFVANDSLYYIYNSYKNELDPLSDKEQLVVTKDTLKIGKIVAGKFHPICVLKDHIDIDLQQQLSPDYQICTFHTEQRITIGFKKDIPPYKEARYGVIEIKNNQIKIHYFISRTKG